MQGKVTAKAEGKARQALLGYRQGQAKAGQQARPQVPTNSIFSLV